VLRPHYVRPIGFLKQVQTSVNSLEQRAKGYGLQHTTIYNSTSTCHNAPKLFHRPYKMLKIVISTGT